MPLLRNKRPVLVVLIAGALEPIRPGLQSFSAGITYEDFDLPGYIAILLRVAIFVSHPSGREENRLCWILDSGRVEKFLQRRSMRSTCVGQGSSRCSIGLDVEGKPP